jgi:hypothetical protein
MEKRSRVKILCKCTFHTLSSSPARQEHLTRTKMYGASEQISTIKVQIVEKVEDCKNATICPKILLFTELKGTYCTA